MDEQGAKDASGYVSPSELDVAALLAVMEAHAKTGWVWDAASHALVHLEAPAKHDYIDLRTRRLSISPALADAFRSGEEWLP